MGILKSPPFWFVIRFYCACMYRCFCRHLYADKDKIDEAMAEQQKSIIASSHPSRLF